MTQTPAVLTGRMARADRAIPIVVLGACLGWAFWPVLAEMSQRWAHDPRYSHGYLVPGFALFLLWTRRPWPGRASTGEGWWGLLIVAAGVAVHVAGAYLSINWVEALALLPLLAGLAVLLGGREGLRWSWPAILFLLFMIPLPYRLEIAMGRPLQRMATDASTFALQTLGFAALAEGNIIVLERGRIGVVEACSGLSMLVTFFALSTAVAFMIRKPLLDKALILLSAAPIALVTNIVRITVTGALHELVDSKTANAVFHDLAGWLMIPFALGLLWLELETLKRLLVEPTVKARAPIDLLPIAKSVGPPRRLEGLPGA